MSTALVLSLLVHGLLLSLDFGNQEFGLPGFSLPWQERRFEAGDLHVALVPVQAAATTPALIEPSTNLKPGGMARPEPVAAPSPAPAPVLIASERSNMATLVASVTPVVVAAPVMEAAPSDTSAVVVQPTPRQESEAAKTQIDSVARERDLELARLKRAKQDAQQQADQMEAAQESADRQQAERTQTARVDAEREEAARQVVARNETAQAEIERLAAAQQAMARQEAARAEAARVDAERKEAARQVVARNEAAQAEIDRLAAAQQAVARHASERAEAARLDAEQKEAARQVVARNEAAQAEIERLAAARQAVARHASERAEATRLDAEQKEATRQVVTRNEAAQAEIDRLAAVQQATARQASERAEAARVDAERLKAAQGEQEAKREARLRAIGRQLDEEAARRDAASLAARALHPSSSGARRGRLFGRTDPNTELILYAEAWSRKIELNMTFDLVREAVKQRHTNPLVTVALRSDGSVESVTFVVSSGVAEIDDAVRRIVQSQAPYRSFPPGLASDYDVIEIRRSWHFDTAVRLF